MRLQHASIARRSELGGHRAKPCKAIGQQGDNLRRRLRVFCAGRAGGRFEPGASPPSADVSVARGCDSHVSTHPPQGGAGRRRAHRRLAAVLPADLVSLLRDRPTYSTLQARTDSSLPPCPPTAYVACVASGECDHVLPPVLTRALRSSPAPCDLQISARSCIPMNAPLPDHCGGWGVPRTLASCAQYSAVIQPRPRASAVQTRASTVLSTGWAPLVVPEKV